MLLRAIRQALTLPVPATAADGVRRLKLLEVRSRLVAGTCRRLLDAREADGEGAALAARSRPTRA